MINLAAYASDAAFLEQLDQVKRTRKNILASYIRTEYGQQIDTESVFDIQIKRFHLYKRQLLNILHILNLYYALKENPNMNYCLQ